MREAVIVASPYAACQVAPRLVQPRAPDDLAAHAIRHVHRQKGRYGVVTMCVGGGQGAAALFERV